MLNLEYYRNEIEKLDFCFGKKDGKLYSCLGFNCTECDFGFSRCHSTSIEWLAEEHVDEVDETEMSISD